MEDNAAVNCQANFAKYDLEKYFAGEIGSFELLERLEQRVDSIRQALQV